MPMFNSGCSAAASGEERGGRVDPPTPRPLHLWYWGVLVNRCVMAERMVVRIGVLEQDKMRMVIMMRVL